MAAPPRHRPRAARWRAALAAALVPALSLAGDARGESLDGLPDQQVKIAFVYNFAKFVEWPAEAFGAPQAPVTLCTPPRTPLSGALATIEGRRVQGRELRIRRDVRADELRGCHILFVTAGDESYVRGASAMPVLTVGDLPGFAAGGGIIGLVMRDERVRFEINPDAAQRAGLRISAQLMRLAIVVGDNGRSRP